MPQGNFNDGSRFKCGNRRTIRRMVSTGGNQGLPRGSIVTYINRLSGIASPSEEFLLRLERLKIGRDLSTARAGLSPVRFAQDDSG
jgi:hypothetical protein